MDYYTERLLFLFFYSYLLLTVLGILAIIKLFIMALLLNYSRLIKFMLRLDSSVGKSDGFITHRSAVQIRLQLGIFSTFLVIEGFVRFIRPAPTRARLASRAKRVERGEQIRSFVFTLQREAQAYLGL